MARPRRKPLAPLQASAEGGVSCCFCRRRTTRLCHVYVISRDDRPWSKVGIAFRIGNRMATYRKKHRIQPTVEHRLELCCESMALTVETAAHALLERQYQRQQGDWFNATSDASIDAVERAIRSDAVGAYR